MAATKKSFVRLPTDVVPVNYKLELTPDLVKHEFSGILDITVKVWLQCYLESIFKCTYNCAGEQANSFSYH